MHTGGEGWGGVGASETTVQKFSVTFFFFFFPFTPPAVAEKVNYSAAAAPLHWERK